MDNIHENASNSIHKNCPKQHTQNCPQIPSKIPMGLLKVYWGVVIYTISFFSKRMDFDWVFEGLNIP